MERNVRTEVLETIRAVPGPNLVLVKDNAFNSLHFGLVYNEPDINAVLVVWARWLGGEQDRRLLEHFAGRVLWGFEWQKGPGLVYSLNRIQ